MLLPLCFQRTGIQVFWHPTLSLSLCRISELVTFVSEYVTQNVGINDIEASQ